MSEVLRLRPQGMANQGMAKAAGSSPNAGQASQAYGAAQMRAMPGVRLAAGEAPSGNQKANKQPGLLGHWALWGAACCLMAGGVVLGASLSGPKPVRVFPVPVSQLPGQSQPAQPQVGMQAQIQPTGHGPNTFHVPTIVVNTPSRLMPGDADRDAQALALDPLAPPPPPKNIAALPLPTDLPLPAVSAQSSALETETAKPQLAELAAPPAIQQPVQQPGQKSVAAKPAAGPAAAQVATLTAPRQPSAPTSAPTLGGERWRQLGVPMPAGAKPPFIAIVIDDMGLARRNSTRAVALPTPLTLSYMSYAPDLAEQTAAARAAGHELMLHLPMEPLDVRRNDPGPHALLVNQDESEWRRRTLWSLDRFDGYAGVNNHMGSRFTADAQAMGVVLSEISKRGVFWLDSLTGPRSTGVAQAGKLGMASTSRDLFLDDERDAEAGVPAQLAILERIAREHGDAIGIGHPHARTLNALERWLVEAPKRGFTLISASAMLQHRLERQKQP